MSPNELMYTMEKSLSEKITIHGMCAIFYGLKNPNRLQIPILFFVSMKGFKENLIFQV
jgi:hypothetical protein